MSVSLMLWSVFCCGSPSGERVNNSHVREIPEVLVSIIQKHQYHFTSPCFETHRQRLIVTGSFRNALCCICHSLECFPILIPHISMLKPGTETSGPGVTGRGCNARVCRGVCDNGNILTLIVQQRGLFMAQNLNAVWRYLELEWKCREQRNACSSHQSQTPLWFLTNSSCSLRGQLC